MSKNPFGWNYPAGAENDPNAPWNQRPEMCPVCEEFVDCGLLCNAMSHGECDCPKCTGLCVCHLADVDDHPPYEED